MKEDWKIYFIEIYVNTLACSYTVNMVETCYFLAEHHNKTVHPVLSIHNIGMTYDSFIFQCWEWRNSIVTSFEERYKYASYFHFSFFPYPSSFHVYMFLAKKTQVLLISCEKNHIKFSWFLAKKIISSFLGFLRKKPFKFYLGF